MGFQMQSVVDELRESLPPVFLGANIDEFTGGAICWRTTQNKRSRREIPDECFVRSGPRILVRRDLFLDWWSGTLTEARLPPRNGPPRRRQRMRTGSTGEATRYVPHGQPRGSPSSRPG
jgi:hypothetical protein